MFGNLWEYFKNQCKKNRWVNDELKWGKTLNFAQYSFVFYNFLWRLPESFRLLYFSCYYVGLPRSSLHQFRIKEFLFSLFLYFIRVTISVFVFDKLDFIELKNIFACICKHKCNANSRWRWEQLNRCALCW